jgi:citrate synthase
MRIKVDDLLAPAHRGPMTDAALEVPRGLAGVVVTDTEVGDVRGAEGFFHYRQHSAVELAEHRTVEDVWRLLLDGALPADEAERRRFAAEVRPGRAVPDAAGDALVAIARSGVSPSDGLRTALSLAGAARRARPLVDTTPEERRADVVALASVVPTLAGTLWRAGRGLPPLPARDDLGHGAHLLWQVHGVEPDPDLARALEQYLVLTIDHGFNASTFTARVVASTGADACACLVAAYGALSGPRHGGSPSRVLELLDALHDLDATALEAGLRRRLEAGERLMGFGHPVYRTTDPRSTALAAVARRVGASRARQTALVQEVAERLLAERSPARPHRANVELWAAVVLEACGVPRELFTATFAASRCLGWGVHVLEQAADTKIIRPAARYVGPEPPVPVPVPA